MFLVRTVLGRRADPTDFLCVRGGRGYSTLEVGTEYFLRTQTVDRERLRAPCHQYGTGEWSVRIKYVLRAQALQAVRAGT